MKSGCVLFDKYENEITCVYGQPSTGKTTLAKLAAISQASNGNKVVFIDTEGSFSVDRIKQIAGNDVEKILENIILFKPKRFSEQNKIIKSLPDMKNISLIIIDTIGYYYRAKVKEKPKVYNMWMARQFSILKELSKNTPVIITNQVYSNMKNEIIMVGGEMFRKNSDRIIKLNKEPRKIIFESSPDKEKKFEIVNDGFALKE